jgi:hypothetical protein
LAIFADLADGKIVQIAFSAAPAPVIIMNQAPAFIGRLDEKWPRRTRKTKKPLRRMA